MAEITCRHAQAVDMKRIKEIIPLAFDEAAARPDIVEDLENETWYSCEHWLVAEADGVVVSALALRPGVMWVAGVAVSVRTVGTVCTHPDYRARGIGRQLMAFADEVMSAEGVVLSRLHTSPMRYAFYGRCGYVKAIQNWDAAVLEIEAIGPGVRKRAEVDLGDAVVRPAHARDADRMNAIYEATCTHATGHISRNEHFFGRRIARHAKPWTWVPPKFDVVEDPVDGVVGYVGYLLEDDRKQIVELATLERHAPLARTLVLHVAREAQDRGLKRLDVCLDRHLPLGWVVREFNMRIEPDSGVMFLKVEDDARLIEMMTPVVARRAERFEVALTMSPAGFGDVTLGDGQSVRIVTDAAHFATLVYNGVWLNGLLGQGALQIIPDTRSAHEAVQRVFPDTHASRARIDGY